MNVLEEPVQTSCHLYSLKSELVKHFITYSFFWGL